MKYSKARCEWGELFGLDIASLSNEQLDKIDVTKLIEFIKIDPRAEKIVSDKIVSDKSAIGALTAISSFEDEIASCQYFVNKYNELYTKAGGELDKLIKNNYAYRREYIYWKLLNEENKKIEFARWSKSEDSIVNTSNADYNWLYKHDPTLAESVMDRVLADSHSHNPSSAVLNLIQNVPIDKINVLMPKLFNKDKQLYMYALENSNIPEEYAVRALRVTAKRTRIPSIRVKITESILKKIPTVTRLEILESILRCGQFRYRGGSSASSLKFDGITEDVLRNLLFGNVVKHNSRVEGVLKRFKELKLDGVKNE